MTFKKVLLLTIFLLPLAASLSFAQKQEDIDAQDIASGAIFDDKALLEGYAQKYADENQDILLAMIADDSLGSYKCAAAIRVFKTNFAPTVLSKDKPNVIRILARRLNRTDSPFVQVEIMHTMIILDRYQYFEPMIISLIQKMDHYNPVVSALAYQDVQDTVKDSTRTREARVIFNTLRKMLFLARNHLQNITEPDMKLRQKIDVLRWSIKVLGTQELKRLPPEVINLL